MILSAKDLKSHNKFHCILIVIIFLMLYKLSMKITKKFIELFKNLT